LYDAWNFREPSNGVTNLRGFDDRHASFTLQNAVVEATWTKGVVSGRIALQVGDEPGAFYAFEPSQAPSGTAPATGPTEWRHIQEAWVAWKLPCYRLELSGGIFLSPIGAETPIVRDAWNWSRSNLFYFLPYYHAGVRAKHDIGDSGWSVTAALYNGWNNAIDDNDSPSIDVIARYEKGDWSGQVQYFGGIERSPDAPEGQPWRHLFDAYVQGPIVDKLSFIVQADAGFELDTISVPGPAVVDATASWSSFAGYLRYDLRKNLFVAARGDFFHANRPDAATPIFLPSGVSWVTSATATAAWRPADGLELRAEYRHDQASENAYFGGTVLTDPVTGNAITNRTVQDTITGGVIAWF
ncbi:MAG: outer membrane beta-barrel protein, partial [Acidobacteriota bacterium]